MASDRRQHNRQDTIHFDLSSLMHFLRLLPRLEVASWQKFFVFSWHRCLLPRFSLSLAAAPSQPRSSFIYFYAVFLSTVYNRTLSMSVLCVTRNKSKLPSIKMIWFAALLNKSCLIICNCSLSN